MKFLSSAALAVLVSVTSPTAIAQTGDVQAKIDRLPEIFRSQALLDTFAEYLAGHMLNAVLSARPNLPDDAKAIIEDETKLAFEQSLIELNDDLLFSYAMLFSDAEIDALERFYESPEGRSIAAKMPEFIEFALQAGEHWIVTIVRDLPPRIENRLRREGYGNE
jgi:hypothetical protein